ncbi:hypothetical protein ACXA28_004206 [Salmonella enterica subsp. enterica serovar Chester]|nr:hypothetical protein [Salmonella enterica subsp. enterica serovar Newport]EBZ2757951.1 hypothetical protein [Salmonella enterica subsp. enterica serovar Pomona]ECB7316522.1 hypothetical protein [Salmonella enterica subsp. enterica serovar Treforest]ECD5452731.1 hypothetical protein [Salmonella enterica subsp. enterica serovar Hvittingfoss]ECF2403611.1 hypothetical protein [Salmonella enterica subsp. enterica serovar Singapore]ECW7884720.1 hypothetical protein [Salmonella enterica subsp. ent
MNDIKPQDYRVFCSKLSAVLLATGCAILVAALLAGLFWGQMFEAVYGASATDPGVAGRETDPAMVAEYAALKPLLNLTLYVVPTTLGFTGAGLFLTGAGLAAVDTLAGRWQAWRLKRRAAE